MYVCMYVSMHICMYTKKEQKHENVCMYICMYTKKEQKHEKYPLGKKQYFFSCFFIN